MNLTSTAVLTGLIVVVNTAVFPTPSHAQENRLLADYGRSTQSKSLNKRSRRRPRVRGHCALSNGSSFGPATRWSTVFSDANSWNMGAYYYATIRLVDVTRDGSADLCGRGTLGIWCAPSNRQNGFGAMTLWSNAFPNIGIVSGQTSWSSDPSYWSTIQYADLNKDGFIDVCGRSQNGLICALNNNGSSFGVAGVWTSQFSDAAGWKNEAYYSTIHFADANGDGQADVCGRGIAGFYCGISNGTGFSNPPTPVATGFSDGYGWVLDYYYKTLVFIDVNGDGLADICGRGYEGIYCAISTSSPSVGRSGNVASFAPVFLRVYSFGDINGWNGSQSYWGTVQPAHVVGPTMVRFCGRGGAGILCSSE